MTEAVDTRRPARRVPTDTFGHRLMLARADAGNLTIDQASQRCGILAQSWSNWEKGRLPRDIRDAATAISEGLDIDRDWLLDGGPLNPEPRRRRRDSLAYRRRLSERPMPNRPRRRSVTSRPQILPRRVTA